jgi:flagellar basal-body rod protein FlgG
MNAQQANIDNVAHNLANVNTTGFKKGRMEFEDLVYQQIKAPGSATSTEGQSPVGLDAGLGSRVVATARNFSLGNMRATQGPLDLAIDGQGFFQISLPGGVTGYTRDGTFKVNQDGQVVTKEGYPLEPAITIPAGTTTIDISKDGIVTTSTQGQPSQPAGTIELANFQNPAGLTPRGGNVFTANEASGDATTGVAGVDGLGSITQGFLEDSNVSVVEEMVNMILGQRAYEASSKVIRAADEMLQQVNSLAR